MYVSEIPEVSELPQNITEYRITNSLMPLQSKLSSTVDYYHYFMKAGFFCLLHLQLPSIQLAFVKLLKINAKKVIL